MKILSMKAVIIFHHYMLQEIILRIQLFLMATRLYIILKFYQKNSNVRVITVYGLMMKQMSGFRQ